MKQLSLGEIKSSKKLDQYSKDELISKYSNLESNYHEAIKEIYKLKYKDLTEEQLNLVLQEHLLELRQEVYGASSERLKNPVPKLQKEKSSEPRVRLPERSGPAPLRLQSAAPAQTRSTQPAPSGASPHRRRERCVLAPRSSGDERTPLPGRALA